MNSDHNDLEKIEDGLSKKLIYRKIGNVGLAIEAGLGKLFNKYRLLINNLTNVVLPAPSSP